MATAKKLPSGNWRVQLYVGKDKDGRKIMASFTAPTKREAERQAAVYQAEHNRSSAPTSMTVKEAIDRYIAAKEPVLSPSTVRVYRQMQTSRYESINQLPLYKLTTEDMQRFISSLAGTISAKSVSNAYGLLSSAVSMFRPEAVFRVSLPKRVKIRRSSPSDTDIQTLFNSASEDLKISIALAAFGSMRRGEICALKYGDLDGTTFYVHADLVLNSQNEYEYKEIPKTSDSVRLVRMPAKVMDLIPDQEGHGADEFIIKRSPASITCGFIKLRDKLGIDIRFHDLRHYYASIGAALGVPDNYMSEFGGWKRGSSVMKEVYQNSVSSEAEKFSARLSDHFSGLISGNDF